MRAALFIIVFIIVVSALSTTNLDLQAVSRSPTSIWEKRGALNIEYKCSTYVLYTIKYIEKVKEKVCDMVKRGRTNFHHGNYPKKFTDPIENLKFRAFGENYYYFPLLENGRIYTNIWAKFHTGSYIVIVPENCLVATVYRKHRKVLPQDAPGSDSYLPKKGSKFGPMFEKTSCTHLNSN
ncbi:hypothetical protein K3495_g11302 [Podosphaera aphanis]|nr:hypothetical protein K3495_g11302 [Podosphaera aphanis]